MDIHEPNGRIDADGEFLRQHVAELAERFDAVQVFVSRHDPETGATASRDCGAGNHYARRGQCADWLDRAIEFMGQPEWLGDDEDL